MDCTRKNKCTTTTTTVAGTCEGYQCPSGMMDDEDAPTSCSSGTCSDDECCKVEKGTCEGFTGCGYGGELKSVLPHECRGATCQWYECCQKKTVKKGTCKGYRCGRGWSPKSKAPSECRGARCEMKECCETVTTTTTPKTKRMEQKPPPPTTTTTTLPTVPRGKNCEEPRGNPKVCHFWGEPHFTTMFNDNTEVKSSARGGRIMHHRAMEFHESGVFTVAKAHGNVVQGFFCPGPSINVQTKWGHKINYNPTSSACGLAISMADGTKISIMRSKKTKSLSSAKFTNENAMNKGDPSILTIKVNGEERDWHDLSPNGVKKGDGKLAVGAEVSEWAQGIAIGQKSYISQHHSKAPRGESQIATAPVCVGDFDKNFVADVSVPIVKGHWPLVYEMSVTILASASEHVGLCGDPQMQNLIKSGRSGKPGFLGPAVDKYRIKTSESLFTAAEMAELCDSCDMDCETNQLHGENRGSFCDHQGYSADEAEQSCEDQMGREHDWFDTCVIEQCASGGQAAGLVHAEEAFQKFLEGLD